MKSYHRCTTIWCKRSFLGTFITTKISRYILDRLLNSEELTDVKIACGGETFSSSQLLLAANSEYFKAMFLNEYEEDAGSSFANFTAIIAGQSLASPCVLLRRNFYILLCKSWRGSMIFCARDQLYLLYQHFMSWQNFPLLKALISVLVKAENAVYLLKKWILKFWRR